eukprot:GFUD01027909.1.p1 GENE.GFUD01027909.1~~GFUD01027909.1.p1  ORF type:complete len:741 (-),score=120.67 GFUD01027909.1:127-2277(-)
MHLNTDNSDMMSVVHPDQNIKFSIQQDRTYKHHLKSAVNVLLDTTTRKLMMTVKVPDVETPFSMQGHSQSFLYTTDNKIIGSQIYLQKSCPTCLMRQVVSKGEDHRRNIDILAEYHEIGHVYGMKVDGRVFDCEVNEAFSPGQRFLTLLKSVNPLNKEPKNVLNILVSGIRQVHAFLFYFPMIESCGMHFMLSQSTMDPVKEIVLDFDLKKFQNIEQPRKLMKEKVISVIGDVIFKGRVNRMHHIALEYVAAPMWTKSHLDLDIIRKPFVLQAKNYPEFPIIFHMRTKAMPKMNDRPLQFKDLTSVGTYRIQSTMELMWGHPDLKVKIEGDHKTTAEAINHLHSMWYHKTCMREHSLPEWRQSEGIPTTDACLYTMHDLFTLRHYTWDITATNLEPWMVSAYKKMGALVKTSLFPFWEFTPEFTSHEVAPRQPKLRIEQIFHPKLNTFDLTLQVDKDVSKFMGVNYGILEWNTEPYLRLNRIPIPFYHSSYLRPEFVNYMYYNNVINHCHATSHSVRTYDNVTYPYTMDHSCWTLISSDCNEHPSFAVFMKKEKKTPLGLMFFIGDLKVEFVPIKTNVFRIYVKGDIGQGKQGPYDLTDKDFLYWSPTEGTKLNTVLPDFMFKIFRRQNNYVVDFFPQMMINYDGNSVQVLAGPQVKGQHCGMCGDYNRNTYHELLDPQMCPLNTGDEMARAWALDTKYCSTKVTKPECLQSVRHL